MSICASCTNIFIFCYNLISWRNSVSSVCWSVAELIKSLHLPANWQHVTDIADTQVIGRWELIHNGCCHFIVPTGINPLSLCTVLLRGPSVKLQSDGPCGTPREQMDYYTIIKRQEWNRNRKDSPDSHSLCHNRFRMMYDMNKNSPLHKLQLDQSVHMSKVKKQVWFY